MPTAFIHPVNMAASPERGGVILGGASGMLGTALRSGLAGRQTPTMQLVRGTATEGQLRWDATKPLPASESSRLEGFSAAIHLGGANLADHRWTPAYRQEIWTSRVDSTRALAMTLAALRRPPQCLLVASAVGFYGNRGEELLTENSSAGSGFLADLCREWEAAAEPAVNAGIRVVHLRTGVVLGHGHGALERMLPPFRIWDWGKARKRQAVDELDQPRRRYSRNSVCTWDCVDLRTGESHLAEPGYERRVHTRARTATWPTGDSEHSRVCAQARSGANGR